MIKEALEYLVRLGQDKTVEVNGQIYSIERLHHVTYPKATPLEVATLAGLTEYIRSKFDEHAQTEEVMVHIVSHNQVRLVSFLFDDGGREVYIDATAPNPRFDFGRFLSLEEFIIGLQSCFVRNDDVTRILKVVGNIKDSAVKQYGDDGVTQQVTIKAGVAVVDDVAVPNPVMLAPYRTFLEVEQPESQFIFRMRQGNHGPECGLFEADGGAWRLDAIEAVKLYLATQLEGTDIPVIS